MSEMWKPKDPSLLRSWLVAIIDEAQDELSTWELKFIADMETLLDREQRLSEAQEKKLEQIYAQRTH